MLPYKSCTKTGLPELFVEGVNTIDQIFERVFADLDKETKDKLKKTVCYQRRHLEVMSFFKDIDKNDDGTIIEKFEPKNLRDEFEYAFKMFSRAMDVVMPKTEAMPYINDFKYASEIRQMIRIQPGAFFRYFGVVGR